MLMIDDLLTEEPSTQGFQKDLQPLTAQLPVDLRRRLWWMSCARGTLTVPRPPWGQFPSFTSFGYTGLY